MFFTDFFTCQCDLGHLHLLVRLFVFFCYLFIFLMIDISCLINIEGLMCSFRVDFPIFRNLNDDKNDSMISTDV